MSRNTLVLLLPLLIIAPAIAAQEKTEKPSPPRMTSLKVHVTFARFQGEKKVASVPYTMSLNADSRPVQLRMGTEVPIKMAGGGVSYRSVGNNLDCFAEALDEARFKVSCSFEQSSVYEDERKAGGFAPISDAPLFRAFKSNAVLLLRDGQAAQHTLATDSVTGEVLKVDVTLNIIK
jgi:hypothetical protein